MRDDRKMLQMSV